MTLCLFRQLLRRKIASSYILPGNKLQNNVFPYLTIREYTISNAFINKWNTSKVSAVCSPQPLPYQNLTRSFKDKDVLTKRCKDCYFQRVDGRWYVFCNTHPRHKQRQKVDERSKWIITHSTHGVKKF